MNLVFEDGP